MRVRHCWGQFTQLYCIAHCSVLSKVKLAVDTSYVLMHGRIPLTPNCEFARHVDVSDKEKKKRKKVKYDDYTVPVRIDQAYRYVPKDENTGSSIYRKPVCTPSYAVAYLRNEALTCHQIGQNISIDVNTM